jgi:hypothetical protein
MSWEPSYQLQLRKESQPGFHGINPRKSRIETNPIFAAKDLAWRLIKKESRDWRINESESELDSDSTPKPKNTKP